MYIIGLFNINIVKALKSWYMVMDSGKENISLLCVRH